MLVNKFLFHPTMKHIKKYLALTIVLFCALTSCIEEFTPEISEEADLLVVQGSIIKGNELQLIEITRTSPYGNPQERPVGGCTVYVVDGNGNSFHFTEGETGFYTANIDQAYLSYNSSFKLHIQTPNGNKYESESESILKGSPVDSVYYSNEAYQSSSEYYSSGMQIYMDLKAPEENTRHYRWTVDETYEYHSRYFIYATWDDELKILVEEYTQDYYTCWKTLPVKGFYSASTANLSVNERKRIPLNYLPASSAKLNYRYSALVKQFTLSDKAYEYWNTNKVESSESGGLYQTQPSQSRSNIYNTVNPDEIILGFFWASSYTEKRMLFEGPFETFVYDDNYCEADTIDINEVGISLFNPYYTHLSDRPDTVYWGTTRSECFDCRLRGGTNIMPEYWEETVIE